MKLVFQTIMMLAVPPGQHPTATTLGPVVRHQPVTAPIIHNPEPATETLDWNRPADLPEFASVMFPEASCSPSMIATALAQVARNATGEVRVVDCAGGYDYTTIQSAIQDAEDGDVIVVLPNRCSADGHYHENLHFNGSAVVLQSLFPDDPAVVECTVINGDRADPVILFDQGEEPESAVVGLTLFNGRGAIACKPAGPSIRNCNLLANRDAWRGGGVWLQHSGPNPAVIENCRISGNSALWGGAVYSDGPVIIRNCLMDHNQARFQGGALRITADGQALVENCTITANSLEEQPLSNGSGVAVATDGSVITGTIISGNDAGGMFEIFVKPGVTLQIDYSAVPVHPAAWGGGGRVLWGSEMVFGDPMFVDARADDYSLAPQSPCIDRAARSPDGDAGGMDLAGHPRLQHCRRDMGAFESARFQDCNANGKPDACEVLAREAIDNNDDGRLDECQQDLWVDCRECPGPGMGTVQDPYCSVQQAVYSARSGDTVILRPSDGCPDGAYLENIDLLGRAITLSGMDPEDPGTVEHTIIDGSANDRSTITMRSQEHSVLTGLTITGGAGTRVPFDLGADEFSNEYLVHYGGGILCHNSSPVIRHCVITANRANWGGGMMIKGGTAVIERCAFTDNLAYVESYGGFAARTLGGALRIQDSKIVLSHCQISHNTIDAFNENWGEPLSAYGAGIAIWNSADLTSDVMIRNCEIRGNAVINGDPDDYFELYAGGGLFAYAAEFHGVVHYGPYRLTLRNTLVADNSAITENSGGLAAVGARWFSMQGCTVTHNFGGGLYFSTNAGAIRQSIVVANEPNSVLVQNFGNVTASYSNLEPLNDTIIPGLGNINADPQFVAPELQDYHLRDTSPCVDAGDPEFQADAGETDLDGDPRLLGRRVDMGSDEHRP